MADDLLVEIVDDGSGGADPDSGTGLRGLADRVDSLGGRIEVHSPPGAGTRVSARLPLRSRLTGPPQGFSWSAAQTAPSSRGATCFLRLTTPGSEITPSVICSPKARSTGALSPATSSWVSSRRMSVTMRA